MCRNSGRMIEIATERTPTSAQLGRQISKLARTLRGNRFGLVRPFRRRFAGSDGAGRRPAAAPRLGPFLVAQASAARASP